MFDHAHGEFENAVFAELYKFGDAEGFDIELIFEAKLLLDLDFDPQSLAVEAVLIALPVALHGFVALVNVFLDPSPGTVNAHRVIRSNRTIPKLQLLPAATI